MNKNEESYLVHYGVLGMKWGRRKKSLGSRSKRSEDRAKKRAEKKANKAANKRIKKERAKASKNRRMLSDQELHSRIKRLETEKRLKQLTDEDVAPGKAAAKRVLKTSGNRLISGITGVGVGVGVGLASYGVRKQLLKRVGKNEELADFIVPQPRNQKKKKKH